MILFANTSPLFAQETPAGVELDAENEFTTDLLTSESKKSWYDEIDWTLYFRLSANLQNRLFIDPGQEDFIDYLRVSIGLDFYFKNFFIEGNDQFRRNDSSATVGYQLFDNDNYKIDLLIGHTYLNGISETRGNLIRDDASEAFEGIEERSDDSSQGFRFAQYRDTSAWWVDIAGDVIADTHGGWLIDGYYSKLFYARNWDIQIGAGLTLFSSNYVDYYAAVRPSEVRPDRPAYRADEGYRVSFDASAQYPISKNLLFVTGVELAHFSSAFEDSPLYLRSTKMNLHMGVMYVW